MSANMISFHVPDDPELLAMVGEIAIRHEHMNHVLKMMIKTLAEIKASEAIAATKYESSSQWRIRVSKIAKKRLGDGAALLKLQAMLHECKRLTERRNELLHSLWAKSRGSDNAHLQDEYGLTQSLPTISELKNLAIELKKIVLLLNSERLSGFIAEAMKTNGS